MGDPAFRRGLAARGPGDVPPVPGGPPRLGECAWRLGLRRRPTTTSPGGGGDLARPPPRLRTGLLGGDFAALAGDRAPPREAGGRGDRDLAGERDAFPDEAAERWLATLPLDDAALAPRIRPPPLADDAVDPAVPGLLLADALPPTTDDGTAPRRPPPSPGRGEIGATPPDGMVDSLFLPAPPGRVDDLDGRGAPLPPGPDDRRRFPSPDEFSSLVVRPNDDADEDERDARRRPRRTLDAPLAMLCFHRARCGEEGAGETSRCYVGTC